MTAKDLEKLGYYPIPKDVRIRAWIDANVGMPLALHQMTLVEANQLFQQEYPYMTLIPPSPYNPKSSGWVKYGT